MFNSDYYLNELKSVINGNFEVLDIYLFSSFYYEYNMEAIKILIKKEQYLGIVKAFNSLPLKVRYLIYDYVINENSFFNISQKCKVELTDLTYYINCALKLLKLNYIEFYM